MGLREDRDALMQVQSGRSEAAATRHPERLSGSRPALIVPVVLVCWLDLCLTPAMSLSVANNRSASILVSTAVGSSRIRQRASRMSALMAAASTVRIGLAWVVGVGTVEEDSSRGST